MTRFVLVVDSPPHLADALADARAAGARVVEGWDGGDGDVCTGAVAAFGDAAAALLAAVAGARLVVAVERLDGLAARLFDDLRRIGPTEVLTAASPRRPMLTPVQRELLARLGAGQTLGSAAAELGISRRSADRRLAEARQALGASSTAEAVVAYARLAGAAGPADA